MIGVVLAALVVGIARFSPPYKARRIRKAEAKRQQEEKEQKEQKEQAEQFRQREASFLEARFAVYIRDKDGKKSSSEAFLTRDLLQRGVTIVPLLEAIGKEILGGDFGRFPKDVCVLVGTAWGNPNNSSDYCDYRLVTVAGGNEGRIVGAGHHRYPKGKHAKFAEWIVHNLISTFPIPEEKPC